VNTVERLIRQEKNPEVLREISLFILQQSELMAKENETLKKKIADKKQSQEWLNAALQAHLHKLQRRFFENGRESLGTRKRRTDKDQQLLLHAQSLAGEPSKVEKFDLPKEEQPHFASALKVLALAQSKDPGLTKETAEITEMEGFAETSTEITITERVYKKVVHKRQKYKVKNTVTDKETIVTAPGPLKLLPGSRYSIDFALSVVGGKFLNHLPYERQQRDMKRLGLKIPVMTLFRLAEQVSVHLEAVADQIRKDVLSAKLACHLDETRWPILSNHDDDGQMWILSNQAGSYYRFEPTRSGQIADELLKGFTGAVLTDKFSGYHHFRKDAGLVWGLCWAHARREFLDLKVAYEAEVNRIVQAIDDLFDIERKARNWDELAVLRKTESSEKLEEIKGLLEEGRANFFDQDDFCKAAHYVLSAWKEFTAFVDDIRLPLSNNDAERALRHAVLGRKNFNGSKTINGADVAAILYTVIESCKKVELDPIDYMRYVITENQSDQQSLTPLEWAKQLRSSAI